MNVPAIIWLVLVVVFLIIEAACPIHLVSVWFAVGSVCAMIVAWMGGIWWSQLLVFFIVSGVLLALLWPVVRKFMNPQVKATNIDSIIGSTGHVTAAVDNDSACGQVKLGPMEWTARSTSGEEIPVGTLVRVDRIEGVKAFVSPVEKNAKV